MADPLSGITGIFTKELGMTLLGGTLFLVLFAAIGIGLWIWIKGKLKYKTPITVITPKENGGFKQITNLRGGIVKTRKGVVDFEIKQPKKVKKKRLGYMPDLSLAGADDRLTFLVVGDGMVWQQCKQRLIEDGETEVQIKNDKTGDLETVKVPYKLAIEPIPTDIKTITINNIHNVENLLEANKLKATTIAIGAFILMVLVHALFLFLTTS